MTKRAPTIYLRAFAWASAILVFLCGFCAASETVVGPTPAGHVPPPQGIEAWINLRVIQKLTHHTSAVVAAVGMFSLVGFIVQRLLHDSFFKRFFLIFDEVVLLGLFAYLAYDLFVSLIGF